MNDWITPDWPTPPPKELFKNEGFNSDKFNSYFNQNALKDESKEHGYGDWFRSEQEKKEKQEKQEKQEKVSMSNFNSSFESKRKSLSIVAKKEPPKEVFSNESLCVLGEGAPDDYTGKTSNGMNYTDLKHAHQMTYLIYNTEELLNENKNITFEEANARNKQRPTNLVDSEFHLIEEMKRNELENEKKRQYRLRQFDEDASLHYQKVNRLSLK